MEGLNNTTMITMDFWCIGNMKHASWHWDTAEMHWLHSSGGAFLVACVSVCTKGNDHATNCATQRWFSNKCLKAGKTSCMSVCTDFNASLPPHKLILPDVSVPDCHLQHHRWIRENLQVKLFLPLRIQRLLAGFGLVLFISQTEAAIGVAEPCTELTRWLVQSVQTVW